MTRLDAFAASEGNGVRRRAEIWNASVPLDALGFHVAHDDAEQAEENRRFFEGIFDEDTAESVGAGIRSGMQQGGGATALPAGLLRALVTLGAWFVWRIVCMSPTLFAETILDDSLARKIPTLADRVSVENARSNAIVGTGVYFLGLAVMVFLTGATLYACCQAY